MPDINDFHRFTKVEFDRFKAFKKFRISLNQFNILVGPNNAGKSTVIMAFRILAAAMRTANARKTTPVRGRNGFIQGHKVNLSAISVGEENIFYNYDDTDGAEIVFTLSNGNLLRLQFSKDSGCILVPDADGKAVSSPTVFKKEFNCPIGFVPILGPVEHEEKYNDKETARLALFNFRAARNFRNIWYHFPESFQEFRNVLQETWPGMDITRPELNMENDKPQLDMFCPEERIDRELFWSGFGFQVWCQMLTHLIQSKETSLFLIDEPDIYLHSDLQRQLLMLLREMKPDVLIATHSTEMISDADTNEIVLINKKSNSSKRLRNPSQLVDVFDALGSNTNPILTQLAKTRKALFVEGKDFQILGKFARKLKVDRISNRLDFAVVNVGGFNPEKIHNLKQGMETALGIKINVAIILDKDFRSDAERKAILTACKKFSDRVHILDRKEIENFLLDPNAIDRALAHRVVIQEERTNKKIDFKFSAEKVLNDYSNARKTYVTSQISAKYRVYGKAASSHLDEATLDEKVLDEIEKLWAIQTDRLRLLPGKDALAEINRIAQKAYGVGITANAIIDAMTIGEIPQEMKDLIQMLEKFGATPINAQKN